MRSSTRPNSPKDFLNGKNTYVNRRERRHTAASRRQMASPVYEPWPLSPSAAAGLASHAVLACPTECHSSQRFRNRRHTLDGSKVAMPTLE